MTAQPRTERTNSDGPDLIVCTRFGLRVRDRDWLQHRLDLIASITAPSLMAQDDQRFHWVVLVDDGLPADIRERLTDILAPFGSQAFLSKRPNHGPGSLIEVARDRLGLANDQVLLTGRLDDDDAWSVSMVGAVRRHTCSWLERSRRAPGLTFTFQDGLEWVMYEMVDVERLMESGERLVHPPSIRHYSLPFIGTSVFVCCPLSEGGTSMSGSHARVAQRLGASKGFETEILPTSQPMWLCCRHKQAGSTIRKARGEELQLSLRDLARDFGLDQAKVQRYLDDADNHQYTLLKTPLTKKAELVHEWLQIKKQIDDSTTLEASALQALEQRQEDLTSEMSRLEDGVLGNPEAAS